MQIVDTDVHPLPRTIDELRECLPESWRRKNFPPEIFDSYYAGNAYPAPADYSDRRAAAMRGDAWPADGGPAGSDPALLDKQLFGDAKVDIAILQPIMVRPMPNPQHEAALAAATNEWMAKTWLGAYNKHGRFRGSLRVCSSDVDLAVREIERWAGHPYFVQVMLTPNSRVRLGEPSQHAIYAAATRHGLAVSTHNNRASGPLQMMPVGFFSYYLEYHTCYATLNWTHLASFVFEGVFEKFPDLKLVIVEAGFSWMVPFVWRMDKYWREFRSELPHVPRPPSEYVKNSVYMTSQPLEEPADEGHLVQLIEWLGAEKRLMFSTDYPHWDYDDPSWVVRRLPKRRAIRLWRSMRSSSTISRQACLTGLALPGQRYRRGSRRRAAGRLMASSTTVHMASASST